MPIEQLHDTTWWSEFAQVATQARVVTALAVICVLQYFVYLWRLRASTAALRGEMGEIQTELNLAEKEGVIARLENRLLRDFLAEADCDRALRALLRHFIPNTQQGFAAYLQLQSCEPVVRQCRGLSRESRKQLEFDPELLRRAAADGPFVLQGRQLYRSALLASLSAVDRRKVERIFVAGVEENGRFSAALVTTHLFPQGMEQGRQFDLMHRLARSIGFRQGRAEALKLQQNQLHWTSKMLDLRSLADQRFDTPMEMIRAFFDELRSKMGADCSALYISMDAADPQHKPLVQCGNVSPLGAQRQWHEFENVIAQTALQANATTVFDHHRLVTLGVSNLINQALAVPLTREDVPIGVICFTRQSSVEFGDAETDLATWAADYLAGTILREVRRAQIEQQARNDGLTQLANRATFDSVIAKEVKTAQEEGASCALILLDVDYFKSVNDTYGHQVGDRVLRMVAQVLKASVANVRANDPITVARYGGEEFAVILPGMQIAGATRIAELIRTGIESTPVETEQGPLHVTVSAGMAICPTHAGDVEGLIAAADEALYQAKAAGRNRNAHPANALAERTTERASVTNAL